MMLRKDPPQLELLHQMIELRDRLARAGQENPRLEYQYKKAIEKLEDTMAYYYTFCVSGLGWVKP